MPAELESSLGVIPATPHQQVGRVHNTQHSVGKALCCLRCKAGKGRSHCQNRSTLVLTKGSVSRFYTHSVKAVLPASEQ